jgi:Zn-dependent membrane protease YugP
MTGFYFLMILFFLASLIVSWMFKSKVKKFSEIPNPSGLSGKEIAEKMLRDSGIYDVKVISTDGSLTDHYNPAEKTVNLSEEVYAGRSVIAAAVAAHECGHAVQHANAYSFLEFRSKMVPMLSVTSRYMQWIILIGILALNYSTIPLTIGVVLFALTTVFTFITLPVEFDASKRAVVWLEQTGTASGTGLAQAKEALRWAASTYVIAALSSLAALLYYASLLARRN